MTYSKRFRVRVPKEESSEEALYLNVFYEAGRLQHEFSENKEESFEVMTIFTERDIEDLPMGDFLRTLPREYIEEEIK